MPQISAFGAGAGALPPLLDERREPLLPLVSLSGEVGGIRRTAVRLRLLAPSRHLCGAGCHGPSCRRHSVPRRHEMLRRPPMASSGGGDVDFVAGLSGPPRPTGCRFVVPDRPGWCGSLGRARYLYGACEPMDAWILPRHADRRVGFRRGDAAWYLGTLSRARSLEVRCEASRPLQLLLRSPLQTQSVFCSRCWSAR